MTITSIKPIKAGAPGRGSSLAPVFALVALSLVANGNSLQCWFIADDFVPLAYLHEYFTNDLGGLLKLLVSPWQDTTTQLLYRPFSELTMIVDYAVWKGNAFGWHLTNLIWHVASTVTFYFLAKALVERADESCSGAQSDRNSISIQNETNATLRGKLTSSVPIAFIAAALFASSPLHTETVAWMIDRVDSICTTFYLLSMFLFVRRAKHWLRWSLASFLLALLSKEMAVTLPAVLGLYVLAFESTKVIVHRTRMFWAILVPYFALRLAILGTPLGGYVGSVGDVFRETTWSRISHCAYEKIFYPFSSVVFKEDHWLVSTMRALFATLGLAGGWRWLSGGWREPAVRLILFSVAWMVVAMLPAIPVFYLNSGLSGERFFYLPSAPMYLLMVALVVAPAQRVGAAIFAAIVCVFSAVSCSNNLVWIESGRDAQLFRSNIQAAVASLSPNQKAVFLNLPRQRNGEHQFYTAEMFLAMLKPPLTVPDLSARVECVQPNTYIDDEQFPLGRLKDLLDERRFSLFMTDKRGQRLSLQEEQNLRRLVAGVGSYPRLSSFNERTPDSMLHPPFELMYDASMVKGASQAILEISNPSTTYVLYSNSFRDRTLSKHDSARIKLNGLTGALTLPIAAFKKKAVYQIRVAALNANGNVVDYVSEPLTLDLRDHGLLRFRQSESK